MVCSFHNGLYIRGRSLTNPTLIEAKYQPRLGQDQASAKRFPKSDKKPCKSNSALLKNSNRAASFATSRQIGALTESRAIAVEALSVLAQAMAFLFLAVHAFIIMPALRKVSFITQNGSHICLPCESGPHHNVNPCCHVLKVTKTLVPKPCEKDHREVVGFRP
jgi:hypothetical protein